MCTPFIYDGVKYDDCYSGWYGPRCMVNGDGQWLYCGDCIEDTLVTDNEITTSTTEVGTNEVSKQTSVESSGDYNDDTETSLETDDGNIYDTEPYIGTTEDNIHDTEPSIETTEDNIYDTEPYTGTTGKPTEFDEQLDVAKSAKKQSLFCF